MTDAQLEAMRTAMEMAALVLGVGVFLFAMWWDGSDPRRETRRSDVAFWLHLLAAPLIVHPIFSLLGLTEGTASTLDAAAVILLYVVLGLVALAIDRRALLVSALAYVLYALNSLFQTYGDVELSFALTALVIGSALLLLSAFWTTARRAVVKPLPERCGRLPVLDRGQAAGDRTGRPSWPSLPRTEGMQYSPPLPGNGEGSLRILARDQLEQPALDRRQDRPQLVAAAQHLAGLADQRPHALAAVQRRAFLDPDIRAARRCGGRPRRRPRRGANSIA